MSDSHIHCASTTSYICPTWAPQFIRHWNGQYLFPHISRNLIKCFTNIPHFSTNGLRKIQLFRPGVPVKMASNMKVCHKCNFSFSETKSRSWSLKMVLIHFGCTIVHNTSMALNSFEVFDWNIGNFDLVKNPDGPD